ncbi:hypothetical protein [Laceyella putida]|uniref:Uncharacterized protein n=1 Tax=Laceyella putida TaxID=110101 RepID=A0ABW2RNE6_9BACL
MSAVVQVHSNLFQVAEEELGRFFQLFGEGVKELSMPSGFIDSVWHRLLKCQTKYKAFCLQTVGKEVGHAQDSGEGRVPWVRDYEKRFGSLHPVWFMDAHGNLDQIVYNEYKATGEWTRGSWRCRPIPGDGGDED